jgi:hypothetical protein
MYKLPKKNGKLKCYKNKQTKKKKKKKEKKRQDSNEFLILVSSNNRNLLKNVGKKLFKN